MTENGNNGEFKGYAKAAIEFIEKQFNDFQAQMNRRFSAMDDEVNEIKTNHLVHIQQRIDGIENAINWNRLWLIGILGTALVSLALELIKRN